MPSTPTMLGCRTPCNTDRIRGLRAGRRDPRAATRDHRSRRLHSAETTERDDAFPGALNPADPTRGPVARPNERDTELPSREKSEFRMQNSERDQLTGAASGI